MTPGTVWYKRHQRYVTFYNAAVAAFEDGGQTSVWYCLLLAEDALY